MVIATAATVGLDAATTFATRGGGPGRDQLRQFASTQPRATPDIADDPRHGPPNAKITLVEFSDFLCPSCQRASKLNAIILANHRHDAALIFKHYPLDTSCNSAISRMVHAGACTIAAASECLHQQGKFWPFHDLIFERGRAYDVKGIEEDVRQLGADVTRFRTCMDAGQGLEAVKRDITEGARLNVTSTPTFLINGLVVTGGISPAVFEDFVAVLSD
jgi:protein-disulfide isomerase